MVTLPHSPAVAPIPTSRTVAPSAAAWRPLADRLIAILRPQPDLLFEGAAPATSRAAVMRAALAAAAAPDADEQVWASLWGAEAPGADAPHLDEGAETEDASEVTEPTGTVGPALPPPGQPRPRRPRHGALQALLRLARGVESEGALRDMLASPGTLTLIVPGMPGNTSSGTAGGSGGDPGLAAALPQLLQALASHYHTDSAGAAMPRLMTAREAFVRPGTSNPGRSGGTSGGTEPAAGAGPSPAWPALGQALRLALETDAPVVILAADPAELPDGVEHLQPRWITIPQLDRETLRAHLALSHPPASGSGSPGVADWAEALPPDAALAQLSMDALLLALRASTPAGVVARLARAVTQLSRPGSATPGGRLAEFPIAPETRREIDRIAADLRDARAGRIAPEEISRGALLIGPPGSGKSELARLMAEAAGVPFYATTLGELQAKGRWHDFLAAMEALFARARQRARHPVSGRTRRGR